MRQKLGIAIAIALAAALHGGVAGAQGAADVAAARDLFIEGSRLADKDLWADARDRFERSLALKRTALTLYSLGVAQRNTGKLVEALESFRAFLAEPATPATKPYEAPARSAVNALSTRIARMDIRIEPAQARTAKVKLDGTVIAAEAIGQARAVNPGKRVLTASVAGFRPARVEVVLVEGEHASLRLVMEPVPLSEIPADTSATAEARIHPAPSSAAPSRALPFALLGSGAALLGGGAALGLLGVNDAASAPTREGAAADRARALALSGDILMGAGVATALAGVVVLAVRPSPSSATAVSIQPFVGPAGAGVRGSF